MSSRPAGLPPHVPPLLGALLVLIGLGAIPMVLEARHRPRQVTCRFEPSSPSRLACSVDGGPDRALATAPVVAPRRAGRNAHIDAEIAFVDGTRLTTADIASVDAGNAPISAAVAGGPSFTLPLSTGRWLAWLLLGIPAGLGLLASFVRSRREG